MKKFQYSLEAVLNYKQQILDSLKEEYAECMARVNAKLADIQRIEERILETEAEFQKVKEEGAVIERFLLFANLITRLQEEQEIEKKQLLVLQQAAERKKDEMVDANIDVNKFEKLKEKKLSEYHTLEQKEQESFIEEFVSNGSRNKV